MASPEETEPEAPTKKSKGPILLGFMLACAGGAGAFYATYSGILPGGNGPAHPEHAATSEGIESMPDVAFVPIEPMVVSLGRGSNRSHLRFRAQLEVVPAYKGEVERLVPRVVDVLNSYLRALDLSDLEDSAALVRLRSQMLRRVQIVTGGERVKDLLVMEFVLN